MDAKQLTVFLLSTVIAVAIIVHPLVRYCWTGWHVKRADIMDSFTAKARQTYFAMFCASQPVPPMGDAVARFEKLYGRYYGRRFYVVPGVLLLLASSLASVLVMLTAFGQLEFLANPLVNLPEIAVAALAGAYLWVANDHIGRARRLDFSPSDVMWAVLRLTIAVPMGYAFAALLAKGLGPFIAFALGAFPLTTLLTYLRRLADKQLGMQAAAAASEDNVINLQGINQAIVDRFNDEDIYTVSQLAYCDPVRLTMRSNLTFNFITDCMNQALAWMYLERDMNVIRKLGMRGAVEIKYLLDELDTEDTADPSDLANRDVARKVLPQIAKAISQEPETLLTTFRQIGEDPFTIFLSEIWTVPEIVDGESTTHK